MAPLDTGMITKGIAFCLSGQHRSGGVYYFHKDVDDLAFPTDVEHLKYLSLRPVRLRDH